MTSRGNRSLSPLSYVNYPHVNLRIDGGSCECAQWDLDLSLDHLGPEAVCSSDFLVGFFTIVVI